MAPKILIACPTLHQVDVGFMTSFLSMRQVGEMKIAIESGSLIYNARSRLAYQAVNGGFDAVLWLDSDMVI